MRKCRFLFCYIGLATGVLSATGCSQLHDFNTVNKDIIDDVNVYFSEENNDIQLEKVNRKKWDNPVIADLDQDGYPDLLLTDHGFSVKLYWNNKGVFSPGWDLIVGDTHGIGVADYDGDGKLDILVSRGGGSGSNARNSKLYHVNQRNIIEGSEFNPNLKKIRGRTNKFFDGDGDGDQDLLLMGFPSMEAKGETENFIYINDGAGNLILTSYLPKSFVDGQKALITDFNDDKIQDIIIYGNNAVKAMKGIGDLTFDDVSSAIFQSPITDVTGIAEIDIDNDGDFDLYLTRASSLKAGTTFYDDKNKTFAFFTMRGDFRFDDLWIGDVFNLENYESSYPHQDIFIGESAYKYEHSGEYHGGQNIRLVSSNALGWPDKFEKPGIYIGYVGNGNWRIAGTTNPPTSGVVRGVASYSASNLTVGPANILLENRAGVFVDVTDNWNLTGLHQSSGAAVADFDNNGHQDIFALKRGDLSRKTVQVLYLNMGDGRFKEAANHGLVSKELGVLGAGADAVDYDVDGMMDLIYANERGKWHLYKNVSPHNSNNFATFSVGQSARDKVNAKDAKVVILACGNQQIRKLGASAAPYSQSAHTRAHFGLGTCKEIDRVDVYWSNGEMVTHTKLAVNVDLKIN